MSPKPPFDSTKTAKLVTTFRVLHVDNSVEGSLALRAELRRSGFQFSMEKASSAESLEQALDQGKWDLIITEYMLPYLTVEMILAMLKKRKMDVPVIVFSEVQTDRALVDSMRAGARDYIAKSNIKDLLMAVEREIQELQTRRTVVSESRRQSILASPPKIQPPVHGGQQVDLSLCGKETVLLVDDDPTFREFMNWTLRRHGYHVIQALDGEEAEYILEHYLEAIHAVICDVIMPNIDGIELARYMVSEKPSIQVIMVSGYNDRPLERGHKVAGRYPIVWKPFDVSKVLKMLREMLVKKPAAAGIKSDLEPSLA